MTTFRTIARLAGSLLGSALLVLGACGGDPSPPGSSPEVARLYAAASLTDVMHTLAARFEREHGVRVVASYAGSNTLALQIREGAPPGVFVSADLDWIRALEERDVLEPQSRVDLLVNALVVVVPRGARQRPKALADLADASYRRVALADPRSVPAGRYARTALERAGIYAALRGRIAAAHDVRTALAYVERGEVDAGLVYATDAAASHRVDTAFRLPEPLQPQIVYPLVLVRGSGVGERALHAFLQSADARVAFDQAGFDRPGR